MSFVGEEMNNECPIICGTCEFYNSDTCFCDKHPEYGELVEQDTCSDWSEDDTIPE